jgi:hypothetical protein
MLSQRYSQTEIDILQQHVDVYRSLPEATTLETVSIEQRGFRAAAAEALAERGIVEITPLNAQTIYQSHTFPTQDEGHTALREQVNDVWEGVKICPPSRNSKGWTFEVPIETKLPGFTTKINSSANPEVVRLYKEGVIKKNNV